MLFNIEQGILAEETGEFMVIIVAAKFANVSTLQIKFLIMH